MRKLIFQTATWLIVLVYFLLFVLLTVTGVVVIKSNNRIGDNYNELTINATTKLRWLFTCRENFEYIQNITIDKVFHPSAIYANENSLYMQNQAVNN
ncbi:MAG: hypothetical protein C4308_13470 [Chitinophagaceae bacterium]